MSGIKVIIDIPENYVRKARYVFGIFANSWGIPIRILKAQKQNDDRADIVYTSKCNKQNNAITIPFDQRLYEGKTKCGSIRLKNNDLWSNSSEATTDLIASSFRLITLIDEEQIKQGSRDRKGIFLIDALPAARKALVKVPIIESLSEYLLNQLLLRKPMLKHAMLPRWPFNKQYVISLTHDTDAVNLGAPKEIITNLAKFSIRREKVHFDMAKLGLRHFGKPMSNPLFAFPLWKEYEALNRIRSSFYLFVMTKNVKVDINDCKSNAMNKAMDWNVLRKMANENWEFGLHASVNAKHSQEAFIDAKAMLEDKLDVNIYGLRHHYWALDWLKPYMTFRKHVNAGFRYDSSLAWRDSPGFRSATCLPYRPFDLERDKPIHMYEIPTCLMDGHIISGDNNFDLSVQNGISIIETVKKFRGVAVLDWHSESACSAFIYKKHLKLLQNILEKYFCDSDVWFATPWEIVRWWHKRSLRLSLGT